MKPDYKNWVPRGMLMSFLWIAIICFVLFAVFIITGFPRAGAANTALWIIFLALGVVFAVLAIWFFIMYRKFSYNGKRKLSKQIIEGTASYAYLPDGGKGLDVGCGSGALAIACAKRFPKGEMVGMDKWGKKYKSFSKEVCEKNAEAEGVKNTSFMQGDAVKLDFPDESFDLVVSNYVYHNIPVSDRKELLLETLRVLKKGGTFAIHDIMSNQKYGDMNAFVQKLKSMGYEHAELIDTAHGLFMTEKEAKLLGLTGSAVLYGKK